MTELVARDGAGSPDPETRGGSAPATRVFRALEVVTVLSLLLAPAMAFLVTLSFDEAWIIAGTANIATDGYFGIGSTIGSTSTGGAYAILEALAALVFGKNLYVARLIVVATLILALREVMLLVGRITPRSEDRWLAVALLLGVPGTLFFASIADGTMPALWLMLWSVRLWSFTETERLTWQRTASVGLLLGLTVATRLNFALLVPAFVVASAAHPEGRRVRVQKALVAAAVSAVVVALNFAVLVSLTRASVSSNAGAASYATGLSDLLSAMHPNLLTQKAMALQASFPTGAVCVAILLALPYAVRMRGERPEAEAALVLLLFGMALLAAWLVSPRFLYRYVLPALLCVLLGLVVIGLGLLEKLGPRARQGALVAASVWALGQLVAEDFRSVRIALHGDGDNVIAWFTGERAPRGLYSLVAKNAERSTVDFVRALPRDATVTTLGPDALDVIFFTGRDVRNIATFRDGLPRRGPVYVLLRPAMGYDLDLTDEARRFLEQSCTLERSFGRVKVYRVKDDARLQRTGAELETLDWRTML